MTFHRLFHTTNVNEPTLIKDNSAKLVKNITELGKAEVAPSCMDAYGSGPDPSLVSFPSPVQVDVDLSLSLTFSPFYIGSFLYSFLFTC